MRGSTPIATATRAASSFSGHGWSAPTLNTWFQARGSSIAAAITGATSSM